MSTVQIDTPNGDDFAENMQKVILTLMAARGLKVADMWRLLHMKRGTWYNRMADANWTARQLAHLAEVLDVKIEDLYADPRDLVRSRCFAPLTLVSDLPDNDDDGEAHEEPRDVTRPTLSVVRG